MKIKVFISDDHIILRKGLVDYCKQKNFHVVGQATSVEELLKKYDKGVDVYIVDLNMKTTRGIDTLEKIYKKHPEAPCLVYSMRETVSVIKAAYKAGAKGYVTKDQGLEIVEDAIKKIAEGKKYYMPGMAEKLLEDEEENIFKQLTKKEMQFFTYISEGKTKEEVAEIMNVQVSHVVNIISIIRKKLDIPITSFQWIAIKNGIINKDY